MGRLSNTMNSKLHYIQSVHNQHNPKSLNNPYDEFEASECLAHYAHNEAIAARDKEWVEWVVTNAEVEGDTIILPGKLWRERRKEIGL